MYESIENYVSSLPLWMYYNPVLTFVLLALSLFTFINFSGYCCIEEKLKELVINVNDLVSSMEELSQQSRYDNNRLSNLEQRVDRNDQAHSSTSERISGHYTQWSKMFEQTNAKITGTREMLEALNNHFQQLDKDFHEQIKITKQVTDPLQVGLTNIQEDYKRLKEQSKCLVNSVDLYWTATRTVEQKLSVMPPERIANIESTLTALDSNVQNQLNTIKSDCNRNTANWSSTVGEVGRISGEQIELKNKHKALEEYIDTKVAVPLQNQLFSIRDEQIKLRNGESNHASHINSIKSDIAANAGNFLNLSGEVNSLQVELVTLKQSLDNLHTGYKHHAGAHDTIDSRFSELEKLAGTHNKSLNELRRHAEESGKFSGSKLEQCTKDIEQLKVRVQTFMKHLENTDNVLQFTNSKVDAFLSEERGTEVLSLDKLIGILQTANPKQDRQTVYVDNKGNTVDVEQLPPIRTPEPQTDYDSEEVASKLKARALGNRPTY